MTLKLGAAARLATARPLPPSNHMELVKQMMGRCKCDAKTAKHYLSEEGWKLSEAIESFKEDKDRGLHANQLIAALSDKELAQYAESFWNYAKAVGPASDPKFETWFKNRGRLLPYLSEAEIEQIWRAAIRMHS